MSREQLTQEAMALPLSDRVELAETLWQSINEALGPEAAQEEREAAALARQRDTELESGAVQGRSHAEVMATARRALGCE